MRADPTSLANRFKPNATYRSAERIRAWNQYVDRLVWVHGPERAFRILDGIDRPTNADIAAWRNIGKPKGDFDV